MPHFILHCIDSEAGAALRPVTREAHLAHVRGSGVCRIAGPLLDDDGNPIGSLLIVETEDIEAARAFSQGDPYHAAGVFGSVQIMPFRMTHIDLPAQISRG